MNNIKSLNHTKWECKYHIVWIPKYRKKSMYIQIRKFLTASLRDLASHRESEIEEGHLMSVPPKYSVSQVVGYIKGKSAIQIPVDPQIARTFMGRKKNFVGYKFWVRGFYVSTVGKDEKAVREYIKKQ